MGYFEGNCLVISDAFLVLHRENEETGSISLDKEYHRKMVALKKKICPTENVLGWFATCDEIEPSFVSVHNFLATPSESKFVSSQLLPSPVLLTVDPTLSNGDLNIRVSVMQTTVGADSLVQFHQLPLQASEGCAETMALIQSGSEVMTSSRDSESIKDALKTIGSYSNDTDVAVGQSVSLAVQQLKHGAGGDESVSQLRELAKSHFDLVKRVSEVISKDNQIVI